MNIEHELKKRVWAITMIAASAIAPPVLAAAPEQWTAPVKPFRIVDNVYYVGTEGLAAYLITSDQGAILLDAPLADNAALIERNIESVGVPLREVRLLVSNHAHADHVGAMATLKRDSGARLLASVADRPALELGRNLGDNNYGIQPFEPIKVDEFVSDGQTIRMGDVALTAHLTPGHTPGCTSWSMTVNDSGTSRELLFLCSITVAGNTLLGNRSYPGIVEDFRATFSKLETMHADIVLSGHPETAGVLDRQARRTDGDLEAFVDRDLLASLVSKHKKDFEATLAKASAATIRP